jgi:hypothetical protein
VTRSHCLRGRTGPAPPRPPRRRRSRPVTSTPRRSGWPTGGTSIWPHTGRGAARAGLRRLRQRRQARGPPQGTEADRAGRSRADPPRPDGEAQRAVAEGEGGGRKPRAASAGPVPELSLPLEDLPKDWQRALREMRSLRQTLDTGRLSLDDRMPPSAKVIRNLRGPCGSLRAIAFGRVCRSSSRSRPSPSGGGAPGALDRRQGQAAGPKPSHHDREPVQGARGLRRLVRDGRDADPRDPRAPAAPRAREQGRAQAQGGVDAGERRRHRRRLGPGGRVARAARRRRPPRPCARS